MQRTVFGGLLTLLLFVSSAAAQMVSVYRNGALINEWPSGERIRVEVFPTGVTTLKIVGSTPETDIGRVYLHGESNARVDVLIGAVAIDPTASFPGNVDSVLHTAGRHWGGMECDDFNLRWRTRVAFAISGDVKSLHTGEAGSVLAGQVYRGQVGGSARADIRAAPLVANPRGVPGVV